MMSVAEVAARRGVIARYLVSGYQKQRRHLWPRGNHHGGANMYQHVVVATKSGGENNILKQSLNAAGMIW